MTTCHTCTGFLKPVPAAGTKTSSHLHLSSGFIKNFHDITEPGQFLAEPSSPWWIWLLAAAVIVVVLLVIYWIVRPPNRKKLRASQLDKARDQLQKIRAEAAELPAELAATRISLVIRRYLAVAFNEPALFETNEEFCLRDTALEQLHPNCRQPVTRHLTDLSQLKYAPKTSRQPHDATTQLIDEAEDILAKIELNVGSENN